MVPAPVGRRALFILLALAAAVALGTPAAAQTGMLKGKVVDGKGQPVVGAKVTIEFAEGVTRKYEVKTDKKGDFIQIGLPPGRYKVTAEKEKLGQQSFDVRVRLGDAAEVNFVLAPGSAGPTKEEIAKGAAIKAKFDEGVAASKAGDLDGAIAKFTEAIALLPTCFDCYYNIGYAYSQKKDWEQAEAAFKKAIELKADYAEAYNGLATVFNAQKKFEEAAAASAKAVEIAAAAAAAAGATGGGVSVDALYNQGVIAWNAGKAEEAQKRFEEALKLNPDHAPSRFQLGMTLVNQGKLAESVVQFETYLKLAPEGEYAAQAKAMIATLKK